MGIEEAAFDVATEFRFDVGQAVINTNQLTDAVDQLNKTVNSAISGLELLAAGMISHLGLGTGGILGIAMKAFQVSQEFQADTLNFSSNLDENFSMLQGTIGTFNDRLATSKMLMDKIGNVASELGLSGHEMGGIVRMLSPALATNGKLGKDYSGGIQMAKNIMLSSDIMGINREMFARSVSMAITDHMALPRQIFARLVNTPAFKAGGIHLQQQLTNMNTPHKIDLLNKALAELGGNADYLSYRMNLFSTQFQRLKEFLDAMLKPIGDAIGKPLIEMLKKANEFLKSYGVKIGETIADQINKVVANPRYYYGLFEQMTRVKHDFKKAFSWASTLTTVAFAFEMIGKYVPKMGWLKGLGEMAGGLVGLHDSGGFFKAFGSELFKGNTGKLAKTFISIGSVVDNTIISLKGFIGSVGALFFFFQIISRAIAYAKFDDFFQLLRASPQIAAAFLKIKDAITRIQAPIEQIIDTWANLIARILDSRESINLLIWLLEKFANIMSAVADIVSWTMRMIKDSVTIIQRLLMTNFIGNAEARQDLIDEFKKFGHDFMTLPKYDQKTPSPVTYVTNNNHINANFNMREQLEPDRVAFAVTQHLKKLVIDKTQSSGHSIHSGLAAPNGVVQ